LPSAIGFDPCSLDALIKRGGLTAGVLSVMLLHLELDGRVASLPGTAPSACLKPEPNVPMIDILVYLFENYYDFTAHPKPDALARKLSAAGFEEEEISVALDWLDGLKTARVAEFTSDHRSMRLYTDDEQEKLGVDCLNFIVFLEAAGVITPALRELVVERGMLLEDDPLPLGKFKIIVLMVLWSREQDLEPLIVEELLYDADPDLLH